MIVVSDFRISRRIIQALFELEKSDRVKKDVPILSIRRAIAISYLIEVG